MQPSTIRSPRKALGEALLTLCSTALVVIALAGCSKPVTDSGAAKGGAPQKGAIKIGVSFQELDNPYFTVMKEALDEAAGSIGAQLYVTDARHDITKQISDIEDLVQKGVLRGL